MNLKAVDDAFVKMINTKGIDEKLGIDRNYLYQLRSRIKNGESLTLDKKLEMLKKSGWKEDDATYTRADLVSLLKFNARTSQAARDQGPEYVIEKWEKSKS
ncbi:MAG: hypothetical protein ACTHKV_03725 [Flavipsychrobacter sp.]